MRTYPAKTSSDNRLIAFEVESIYLGISVITRLLQRCDFVTDVKRRRLFSSDSDVHIRFKYRGQSCVVWEPYGDSSRYWVGAEAPDAFTSNLREVREAFDNYSPPMHRSLIGDLLSLRFFK